MGRESVRYPGASRKCLVPMEVVAMSDAVQDGPAMNALIHKAVRRDLDGFSTALRNFSDGDKVRAGVIASRFRWFDTLLTHHHEGEEEILWPVLRGNPHDTEEVGELTDEHERIVSTLASARAAMARLGVSAAAADAQAAQQAIADLKAAAVEHFAHEEGEIVELCSHADPDALAAALKKMGRSVPMRESLWFLQWVADGTTPQETAFLRTLIPTPVHWISKAVVGRDYAKQTVPLRV
ncbi:MAG: hemerythrin domain-containing protein [Nakamurella sp.]